MSAASGSTQTIRDVLIGDVWLCSGQSNMVLPVHRALDSRAEIAGSSNPRIRLLTVQQNSNWKPLDDFMSPVQWLVAGPTTVPEFSAVCLYYARELQKSVDVPMGLIASAWGGSRIQTWMSQAALRAAGGYDDALDILAMYPNDSVTAYARWGARWEAWWREHTSSAAEPWSTKPSGEWRVAPRTLGFWEQWGVLELAEYNGMVWYRTSITLSPQQAAQASTLSLGLVDEVDQTWINGRPLGASGKPGSAAERAMSMIGPGPTRTYRLPRGAFKAGENVIVINVLDSYLTGGLYGPPEDRALELADGTTVRLDGEWRYQIAPDVGMPLRAPWEATAGMGVIHNAMIAPLANLGLRGVLWYQGESNTGDERYGELLTRFMADWRAKFGADLPFLIVQLANYGPAPTAPTESYWAELREAQRLAVASDPHAALIVAVDLGERYDVHPANKQEVARRLARAARRIIYGEAIPPSGPIPLAARRDGSSIAVTFSDVTGRLVAYGADGPIGFELCGSAPHTCRYADARIIGDRVLLQAANLTAATKVRYCWADSPVCTLYDEARLPAGPFQIEVDAAN